jgi:hypothetical protein
MRGPHAVPNLKSDGAPFGREAAWGSPMTSKFWMGLALIGAAALAGAPANATITTFTSRAAFDAASGPQTTITFGSVAPAAAANFYGNPGAVSVGPDSFTTNDPDSLLFAISGSPDDGDYGVPYLSAQSDCDCAVNLSIATPGVTAFGFDFGGRFFPATPLFATVNGETFNLGAEINAGQFFGLISSGPTIDSVLLFGHGDGGTDIDLLDVIQSSAAVPEPASWALMLLGLGGLGAVIRGSRRRTGACAQPGV